MDGGEISIPGTVSRTYIPFCALIRASFIDGDRLLSAVENQSEMWYDSV